MWKCIEKTDATGKNMQTQYTKTGNWTSKLLYSKDANHLICDDIVPCCSSFHSFSIFIEKKKFKYDINPALTILHRITCALSLETPRPFRTTWAQSRWLSDYICSFFCLQNEVIFHCTWFTTIWISLISCSTQLEPIRRWVGRQHDRVRD